MAQVRWYLNSTTIDGWQLLDQSAAAAATLVNGWVVGTGLTNSAEFASGAAGDRASTTFVGNTVPDGTLDTTLKDAFRSQNPMTGTFAAGNWTFQFAVVSTVQAGAADGQIVFRVLKANADGSSATEITSAQQAASIATNVGATDVNSSLTISLSSFTITNQYLFVQVAWKRTGAGGMTTTNIRLRTGSSTTVGTTGLTADFVAAVTAATIGSTVTLTAPTVIQPGPDQAVTGTTIASGSSVTAPPLVVRVTADVAIETALQADSPRSPRAVVFVTDQIGYAFFIANSLYYRKTTDGGATWGAQQNLHSYTTLVAFDVWYDRWTPGNAGNSIHIWAFDSTNDYILYRRLDTSNDSTAVYEAAIQGTSAVAGRGAFVSGTVARSGLLYCAFDIDAGAERGFYQSYDGGLTWETLSATFVEASLDTCKLYPASGTGDDNDCWALYYDASALALTVKLWDASAGTEVESATIQAHTDGTTDLTGQFGYDAAVRLSDGHLIIAALSARDVAASTHQVFDVASTSTITTLTAIAASTDDHYYPQVFIDQLTDTIYVTYNGKRDGSEVLDTTTKVYYVQSTDGGASWSAGDTLYMDSAAGAVAQVWTPKTGARFYPVWRIGTNLYGNVGSSLAFDLGVIIGAATIPATSRIFYTDTLLLENSVNAGTVNTTAMAGFLWAQTLSGHTGLLSAVSLHVWTGSPVPTDDVWLELRSGTMTGPLLGLSRRLTAAEIGGAVDWKTFRFDTPIALSAGTTYWLKIMKATGTGQYVFRITADDYAGGGAFNAAGASIGAADFAFRLYTGTSHRVLADQPVAGATIKSTAWASAAIFESEGSPAVTNGLTTGNAGYNWSQTITGHAGTIDGISFGIRNSSAPETDNCYIELRQGSLNGTLLATSAQVAASTFPPFNVAPAWIQFSFAAVTLNRNTTYWIKFFRTTASASQSYEISYTTADHYPPGEAKNELGNQESPGYDLEFRLHFVASQFTTVAIEPIGGQHIPSTARVSFTETLLVEHLGSGNSVVTYLTGRNQCQTLSGHAGVLSSVSLRFQRVGSPRDFIYLVIRESVVDGTILSTSALIAASSISNASHQWVNFRLGGVLLSAGTTYWIETYLTRTASDAANCLNLEFHPFGTYAGGDQTGNFGTPVAGADLAFRLYLGTSHTVDQPQLIEAPTIGAQELLFAPTVALVGAPVTQIILGATITGEGGDLLLEDSSGVLLEDGSDLLLETRAGLAQVFAPSITTAAPDQAVTGATIGGAVTTSSFVGVESPLSESGFWVTPGSWAALAKNNGAYADTSSDGARLTVDVAPNQYAEITYDQDPVGGCWAGVMTRLPGPADPLGYGYLAIAYDGTGFGGIRGVQFYRIADAGSGLTFTLLDGATADVGAAPRRLRLTSVGNVHTVTYNGVDRVVFTDSTHSTGFVGIAAAVFGGPTVLIQSFAGGTVGGAQVFAPTLATGDVAVAGSTIPAASVARVPTVTVGPVTVGGATIPVASLAHAPALAVGPVTVVGATRLSTAQLFTASVTTGPVGVTGATLAATSLVRVPSVAAGSVAVTGATRASTSAVTAPSVALVTTGATIASGSGVFPPQMVALTLTTAARSTTILLFEPTVGLPTALVTAGTVGSVSQGFAPAVAVGAVTVDGATRLSTAQVFVATITVGSFTVGGATVGTTVVLQAATITAGGVTVTGGTVTGTPQTFVPSLAVGAVSVGGATRGTTLQVFAPVLSAMSMGATIGSGSGTFAPTAAYAVTPASLGAASQVFLPVVALAGVTAVGGATLAVGSVLALPTVTTGPVAVGGSTLVSTSLTFVPVLAVGAVTILGATNGSTSQTFVLSVTVGPVTVGGATVGQTALLFTPALTAVEAGAIGAATIPASAVVHAPTVVGGLAVIGAATLAATSTVTAPSVTVGATTVTSATVASGVLVFAPAVVPQGITITGGTQPTTSLLFAPALTVGPVTVTTASRSTTVQVFAPVLTAVSTGATIVSGSGTFAPSVALTVTTGTRAATSQPFAPALTVGSVAVGGTTLAPAGQVFAPTVAVGAVTVLAPTRAPASLTFVPSLVGIVVGASRASASVLFAPTVLPLDVIGGPTTGSTVQLFTASVTTGAVTVVGGTQASTLQVFVPTVEVGVTSITGATRGSTALLFPPAAIVRLDGAFIASTTTLFAPTVQITQFVTGAHHPSGTMLFASSLLPVWAVGGATRLSTTQTFAPSITTGPIGVIGSTVPGTVLLAAPAVGVGAVTVDVPHRASTLVVLAPTVGVTVGVPYRASTVALYPPALAAGAVTVGTGTILSTVQVFAPTLGTGITTATLASTTLPFAPSLAPLVTTPAWIVSTELFPPSALPLGELIGPHQPSTTQVFPPFMVAHGPPSEYHDFESTIVREVMGDVIVCREQDGTVILTREAEVVASVERGVEATSRILSERVFAVGVER